MSFAVELTTPACPVKEQFKAECEALVLSLPWVQHVDVTMTAQPIQPYEGATGLSQVGLWEWG